MGGKRERMVVFVIWYSLQRIVNRHRFLKCTQILRNPTTSEGCKNFSRGLGYTLWVSRRSAWIRAFERTYFHDHPMRRSNNFCEKLIFMEKKRFTYLFESHFSTWRLPYDQRVWLIFLNFFTKNRLKKFSIGVGIML